ncbi:hypothetical protein M0G43_05105 [Subsaxibacter sp. CAU 1640]|uniref:hypothetical protein n=1 Tax=Subsaxibacter sp. CAU 1640 TaxID=2933271 RepID=UPI0020030DC3|nr:hypothetical protein [Subsaxibacter sp. CAU 1640]MCK7589945.1 hypothetical protein [Subsaxibacter sp. CAU 1640]
MKKVFTIFLLGFSLYMFSQEQKVYFDDVILEHIKSFNKQCDLAVENDNIEYVDVLFDSLNRTYLKGTLISDLRLKKISGGYLKTEDIKTPILLISKKSCFVTHREEIKAINEMANQYKGKLEFIVLYWDKKHLAKKATKGYNKNVNIVYVNERDNKLDVTLSSIKNSFGVPSSFYITQNKELSNIDRKFYLKNLKKSTKKEFYENTYNDITELLLENETSKKENIISTRGNN